MRRARVGRRRERLALNLLYLLRGPGVDAATARLVVQPLEMHVVFLDPGRDGGWHVNDKARAPRQDAIRHPPAAVVIARDERVHALDGVTPVERVKPLVPGGDRESTRLNSSH